MATAIVIIVLVDLEEVLELVVESAVVVTYMVATARDGTVKTRAVERLLEAEEAKVVAAKVGKVMVGKASEMGVCAAESDPPERIKSSDSASSESS